MRVVPGLIAAAILASQQGCALTPEAKRMPQPPAPEASALVAGSDVPALRFRGLAGSKGEAAALGAGGAFLGCAAGLGGGSCAGPYCGALVVLWLGVCGVASAAGAVAGAVSAPSADTVRAAEARLATAIDPHTVQETLREQVRLVAAARGERLMPGPEGAEVLVETSVLGAGLDGGGPVEGIGFDPPRALYMDARVRVVRASDGAELHAASQRYEGEALRLGEWAGGNGERLARALEKAYVALGEQLHDEVFLLYPFADRGPHTKGLAASFGLAPLEPPMRTSLTAAPLVGRRLEWSEVRSLRPALRWQSFPRESDRAAAAEEMARVTRVSYDLVIAREHNLAPAVVVYRRERLPQPWHTLEEALAPGAYYFWSVRARFELDGRERVTEWGTVHWAAFGRMTAPSRHSYRFRTPP